MIEPNQKLQPEEWLNRIAKKRGDHQLNPIKTAIELYAGQLSAAYYSGIHLAEILLTLGLDNEAMAAAIIYPALQTNEISSNTIIEWMGESCHLILQNALHIKLLVTQSHVFERADVQTENLRKMLLSIVSDVRSVLIILAERLLELRHVKQMNPALRSRLAQETLAIFAPLANRLGVWQLKWEIEDLCLRYLQPAIYKEIAENIAVRRVDREAFIEQMMVTFTQILQQSNIKNFQVMGRAKHIYSIYKKTQLKNKNLEKIYDMSGLRVLVDSIEDCYAVLSAVSQSEWQQIPEEFDDYISHPKPNGYRSIHTVLRGPGNQVIEIQIRTQQMHAESELGVAAHWRYKEGILQISNEEAKIALLRQVIAWQKEMVGGQEKSEKLIQDLFADRIYVFTPLGDIIDLSVGATPLDFAYHIHSEVGHRCRGAKVNGNIVPLTFQLKTGDHVEILTAKQANPSRDWLNKELGYLNTSRARSKVQHWFRIKDDIPHSVEQAETSPMLVQNSLAKSHLADESSIDYHRNISVQTAGIKNLLTHFALCCNPLPGDQIVGYITRHRGLTVHRAVCRNILNKSKNNQDRLIAVQWNSLSGRKETVGA